MTANQENMEPTTSTNQEKTEAKMDTTINTIHRRMEVLIKASQEEINAAMRDGLGKMEAVINSI
jgi:hypothetical protein